MSKTKHKPPYIEYHKNFRGIFGDALWFAQEAVKIESPTAPLHLIGRYTRNSILNAALSVESAANCCLDALGYPPDQTSEFERLRTIGKYDFFLAHMKNKLTLNRKDAIVKPIIDLLELRNAYVHPKVVRHDFDLDSKSQSGVRLSGNKHKEWMALGVPRMNMRWKPVHAKSVLIKLCDFYNYFFFVLCGFEDHSYGGLRAVCQVLTVEVERNFDKNTHGRLLASDWAGEGYDHIIADQWNLDLSFLGIARMIDGERIRRPSDRFRMKNGDAKTSSDKT